MMRSVAYNPRRREGLMKRTSLLLAVSVLSLSVSGSMVGAQGGGWTTVLDGSSLKGWNVVGNANWSVVDNVVQATKGTGFLVTPVLQRLSDHRRLLGHRRCQ